MKRWMIALLGCFILLCTTAMAESGVIGEWKTPDSSIVLTINADGTWRMEQAGQTINGGWSESQNELQLTNVAGVSLQAHIRSERLIMGGIAFERVPEVTPTPMPTNTPPPMNSEDFAWYTMTDNTELVITKCCGTNTNLVIPESINGMTVVGLSSYSVPDLLDSIYIPATVRMIDEEAFDNAYGLGKIYIDENNPYFTVKENMIFDKTGTTLVLFPVSDYGTYTIPDGTTTIASGAFAGNASMLILPDTITTLEAGFITQDAQRGMRELTIPASVTSIGETDLSGVTLRLEKGSYAQQWADERGYFWIGEGDTIEKDGLLMDKTGAIVIRALSNDYVMPETVKEIWPNAFQSRKWNGVIPDGVTHIGAYAFYNTSYGTWDNPLQNDVIVPDSVTYIGRGAFSLSSCIKSVQLPEMLTMVPECLFQFSYYLEEVKLQNRVTGIGEYAFCSCSSLKNVVMPEGLEWIGLQSFDYCEKLETLYIPTSVTWIDHTFRECPNLTLQVVNGSYAHNWAEEYSVPLALVTKR